MDLHNFFSVSIPRKIWLIRRFLSERPDTPQRKQLSCDVASWIPSALPHSVRPSSQSHLRQSIPERIAIFDGDGGNNRGVLPGMDEVVGQGLVEVVVAFCFLCFENRKCGSCFYCEADRFCWFNSCWFFLLFWLNCPSGTIWVHCDSNLIYTKRKLLFDFTHVFWLLSTGSPIFVIFFKWKRHCHNYWWSTCQSRTIIQDF